MIKTITKSVEFDDEEKDVEFNIEYEIENSGIGSYDFWGSIGYDRGYDYPVINDVTYDKDSYSTEEQKIIDEFIDNNIEEFEEELDE